MVYYPIKMFVIDFDLPEIVFFYDERPIVHHRPHVKEVNFIANTKLSSRYNIYIYIYKFYTEYEKNRCYFG
jgi:hypothetical protein